MCKKIANTELFFKLYHNYLQNRMIYDRYSQPNIESKLLEIFNTRNNRNTYIMMKYCVNDIKSFEFINTDFRNITLSFDSGLFIVVSVNALNEVLYISPTDEFIHFEPS